MAADALLVKLGLVDKDACATFRAQFPGVPTLHVLVRARRVDAQIAAEALQQTLGLPRVDPADVRPARRLIQRVSPEDARRLRFVPVVAVRETKRIQVAFADPTHAGARAAAHACFGVPIDPLVVDDASLDAVLDRVFGAPVPVSAEVPSLEPVRSEEGLPLVIGEAPGPDFLTASTGDGLAPYADAMAERHGRGDAAAVADEDLAWLQNAGQAPPGTSAFDTPHTDTDSTPAVGATRTETASGPVSPSPRQSPIDPLAARATDVMVGASTVVASELLAGPTLGDGLTHEPVPTLEGEETIVDAGPNVDEESR